jgi:hypothetical protein
MKKKAGYSKVISLVIAGILSGIIIGNTRGIPFVMAKGEYSIGILFTDKPLSFDFDEPVKNPVMTASMVNDIKADFVADPFLIKKDNIWYMFFEVLNRETAQGDIGLAKSCDGKRWNYERIILDEPFHLSFPLVFKHDNEYYMVPESRAAYEVRMYKAERFPDRWKFCKKLMTGNFSDPTLFLYNNIWWMFTSDRNDYLRLFYSDSLMGSWYEHPESPVVKSDFIRARSCGKVYISNDTLYRFAQNCENGYGNNVNAFFVNKLDKNNYSEIEYEKNPILKGSGKGWNSLQMHHIAIEEYDSDKYLLSVDGRTRKNKFGFQY